MNSSTRSLILAGVSFALALPTSAAIQPAGTWIVQFSGNGVGDTAYANSDAPVVGRTFRVDQYYSSNSVRIYSQVDDLEIRYNAVNQTATVTGGGVDSERDVSLSPASTGEGSVGTAMTPLFIRDDEVAPGCRRTVAARELFAFPNDDPSSMSYVRRFFSMFDESRPGDCRGALTQLAENIRNGTAGKAWMALEGSGALDLSRLTDLRDAATNFLYAAKKR